MPKYAALIYGDEAAGANMSPDDIAMMHQAYGTYTAAVQEAGVMDGGEALQATTTATTIRVRDGELSTTDGPFAETKEQLGGFYLFEVKDLDEAIEWAAKIPGAAYGSIEVRPIMDVTGM